MAMADFTPNQLSFDTAGFMKEFDSFLTIATNWLSSRVIDLFQNEISINSEASKEMKKAARDSVREISRKIVGGILELEIGVDESYAHSRGTEFYVKTMATIYGNLAQKRIYTKPGQYTWRKDVTDYHLNTKSKKVRRIKQFEQKDHSKKMVNGMLKNVNNMSNKYLDQYIEMIDRFLDAALFDKYVIVR